ncbi:MAG: outer membrane lipid asymmetry maintenance protein MlaD [Pseudomonadota bacterium]
MAERVADTLVGAAVIAAAAGFVLYAANTADLGLGGGSGTTLVAEFRKAEGLAAGGDVRIAGVKVGSISGMTLDPETFVARVTLQVDEGLELPDDTGARITSAGLLGDSYIALEPGASEFMLQDGDVLFRTQDSVNIIDMVSRFVAGGGIEE